MAVNIRMIGLVTLLVMPVMTHAGLRCGSWVIDANESGETTINGQVTNTQKVTFLKSANDYSNMKLEMALSPARDGYPYGFQLIKRSGKAFLSVESLRANIDDPRFFSTYDCHVEG